MYAQVALDVPLFTTLSYTIPEDLEGIVCPGQLVQVPFRNRAKTGLVMEVRAELEDETLAGKVRELIDVVDPEPLLNAKGLDFLKFVADYYLSPIGEVVRLAIPSSIRLEGIKCYHLRHDPPPLSELEDSELVEVVRTLTDEPTPIQKLKELFPKMTYLRLGLLEELGFVEATYEEDRKVRIKTEKVYTMQHPRVDVGRVGAKQQKIIDLFTSPDEEWSMSDIKEQVSSPHSSLRSLVERQILIEDEREVYRDPFAEEPVPPTPTYALTQTQQVAVSAVRTQREKGGFRGFVLHGVTGSGKTAVYAEVIRELLEDGKRGLILLPEIALTPQFVAVFRSHFGDKIAVLHSGLTQAEKFDQWRRIKRDEVEIVIGARSAIFAPIEALGVIIVDEEHDPSFKQNEGTRYNARDMALVRGKIEGAQVILGSATPSLESYYNARYEERMTYLSMPDRVNSRPLPEVEVQDMRGGHALEGSPSTVLSRDMVMNIDRTVREDNQAILFLNRRGYSPCIICEDCGHLWMCENCDVSLTYHRHQESLRCHYCDYSLRVPEVCPSCGSVGPSGKGIGTEKLEEHLNSIFHHAKVARLDRDTGKGRGLRDTIREFRDGEVDVLVGTQMVTKGHDFPRVTLVGVVSADLSLNFPDFRSAERTFQLLTQVAGRAGRGDTPGKVFVQTYNPDHYSLQTAHTHDYETFANHELAMRRETNYPPFGHLIAMKFEAASEGGANQAARDYATAARRQLRKDPALAKSVLVLGPALAPLSKLKGKYRWQMLLKSRSRSAVRRVAIEALNAVGYFDGGGSTHKNVRVIIDVDPTNML